MQNHTYFYQSEENRAIGKKQRKTEDMEKQSNGGNKVRCDAWNQDEREVAETLIGLSSAILDLESDLRIPYQWGRKRKRSAINVSVLLRSPPATTTVAPPKAVCGGGGGEGNFVAAAAAVKTEVSSPATPLSLSLTESEEKPLRTKASLKRKKEYYLKVVEDLTKSKASLNQEVDNVKQYYGKLKALNLKLNQRKQELSNGIGCQMRPQQLVNGQVNPANFNNNIKHHQQFQFQLQQQHFLRLKLNHNISSSSNEGIAQFQHLSMASPISSSPSASLTMININGPIGVPDLNVSAEELVHVDSSKPLDVNATIANKDLSRARAAEARQRRIQIYRLKNPTVGNNSNKPRYSCR